MNYRRVENILYVLIAIIIFLGMPGFWLARSYFEAQSFNRLTGKQATTWDAMWVELRVTGD